MKKYFKTHPPPYKGEEGRLYLCLYAQTDVREANLSVFFFLFERERRI